MVTLRCDETPQLKLGPGTAASWPGSQPYFNERRELVEGSAPRPAGDVIVFKPIAPDPRPGELAPGYASFDEATFPNWRAWLSAPGTPTVYVVDETTGLPIREAAERAASLATLPVQANPLAAPAAQPTAATAEPAKKERTAAQIAASERMKAGAAAARARKKGASS